MIAASQWVHDQYTYRAKCRADEHGQQRVIRPECGTDHRHQGYVAESHRFLLERHLASQPTTRSLPPGAGSDQSILRSREQSAVAMNTAIIALSNPHTSPNTVKPRV